MFHYVQDKVFIKRAKASCVKILNTLVQNLLDRGITSQFFLVGSGARNMIMQNEDGPIDFDYNLNIIKFNDLSNCKNLKETIRKNINAVMRSFDLFDVDDSTSSFTTKPIYFRDAPNISFSMDICIVTKKDDEWYRLIHEKHSNSYEDRYYWNKAPKSFNYKEKSMEIKNIPGEWDIVREQYKTIKNNYLKKTDYNHPSFVCYIEAINNVYNKLKQKKKL